MMNGIPRKLLTLALAAGLGTTGLAAEEQRSVKQARPSYSRDRIERSDVPAPERRELPDTLRIAVPRHEVADSVTDRQRDGAARTRSGNRAEDARHDEIHSRARAAAAWAADEAIDRHGRFRYIEVGFHEGLHDAFRRTRHDRWEFEQGSRSGRLDRAALGLGEEIGYEEAGLIAAEQARLAVTEQFGDLSREPVRRYAPPPPPFTAPGFHVPEPQLRDLFSEISWRGHRGNGLRDVRLDPWRLYQAGGHRDFYKHDWRTAGFAFDLWRRQNRNSSWLRGLDQHERRLFEERFDRAFDAELAGRFAVIADRAFERGYDAGWRYGIRLGREWQFRRGYHLGFETVARDTARRVFSESFRPAWAAAYEELFDEWSSTLQLRASSAHLRDGNDDGIFEPGEEIYADLRLVNLGGGSGTADLTLAGAALAGEDRQRVDLPRRSELRLTEPLRGVIRPAVSPGTDTMVTISLGDLAEALPLRVAHVLRFENGLRLASHDALRGTAMVDVRLANASRLPVLADLGATVRYGKLRRPQRESLEIPAGTSRNVRFDIHDIHPLDLIGGEMVLTVASETGGRAQQRLEARLPELATDLDDRSLVDYLLWLGRSPSADRGEVGRAHELLLRRLEVDWRAAVRDSGNPYRSDLRQGGQATALGELVAAARAQGIRTVDPTVLTGLVPRIDELVRTLPGTHPFLRRSMRKLSRQLL